MQFGSAVSTATDYEEALDQAVPAAFGDLDGPPDLVVCFFSMDHVDAADKLAPALVERAGTSNLIGCTTQAVIAGGREFEDGPGLVLWAARMPGVEVRTFELEVLQLDEERMAITGWPGVESEQQTSALLLPDLFSFPADVFVERLNEQYPGMPVLGGVVSGAFQPGRHRLLHGPEVLDAGAVGTLLTGDVEVRAVVSQGCRPIGQPFVVTRGEGNVVAELGGRPALERMRDVLDELDTRDQAILRLGGLQVGQVIDEQQVEYDRGNFLIRRLAGVDPDNGAIVVGDTVQMGQTLQFHLRDAQAAGEELDLLLEPVRAWDPRGVLLFTCNGRGRRFFDVEDHDAAKVSTATGAVPLGGFFASGEVGPVGGRNLLHSYTASLAVFCVPSEHSAATVTEVAAAPAPPADVSREVPAAPTVVDAAPLGPSGTPEPEQPQEPPEEPREPEPA